MGMINEAALQAQNLSLLGISLRLVSKILSQKSHGIGIFWEGIYLIAKEATFRNNEYFTNLNKAAREPLVFRESQGVVWRQKRNPKFLN